MANNPLVSIMRIPSDVLEKVANNVNVRIANVIWQQDVFVKNVIIHARSGKGKILLTEKCFCVIKLKIFIPSEKNRCKIL